MYFNEKVKWIFVGIAGTLGVFALVVCALFFFFTPLLKMDEDTGRILVFGGLIDIQAKDIITQLSKEGGFVFGNIEGVETIPDAIKGVEIQFGSGEIRVDYNATSEINWDCDGAGKSPKKHVLDKEERIVLDFSSAIVDCDISVPQKPLQITAIFGDIVVKEPTQDLSIKLEKGTVSLGLKLKEEYSFALVASQEVSKEDFISSKKKDAISIQVEVSDGDISRLD